MTPDMQPPTPPFTARVGDLDVVCLPEDRSFALLTATDTRTGKQSVEVIVLAWELPQVIAMFQQLQAYMQQGTTERDLG